MKRLIGVIALAQLATTSIAEDTHIESILKSKGLVVIVNEIRVHRIVEEPVAYPQLQSSLLEVKVAARKQVTYGVKFMIIHGADRTEAFYVDADELQDLLEAINAMERRTIGYPPGGLSYGQSKYFTTRGGTVFAMETSLEFDRLVETERIYDSYSRYRHGFWVGVTSPSDPEFPFGRRMTRFEFPQWLYGLKQALKASIESIRNMAPSQLVKRQSRDIADTPRRQIIGW